MKLLSYGWWKKKMKTYSAGNRIKNCRSKTSHLHSVKYSWTQSDTNNWNLDQKELCCCTIPVFWFWIIIMIRFNCHLILRKCNAVPFPVPGQSNMQGMHDWVWERTAVNCTKFALAYLPFSNLSFLHEHDNILFFVLFLFFRIKICNGNTEFPLFFARDLADSNI